MSAPLSIRTLLLALLLALPACADRPTIAVFSRHTFRAASTQIGPLHFEIGGVDLDLPLLGYHFEATTHGLELARDCGAPALNEAASRAVEALGQQFDGQWDEIRCDLACSRDFFTGLYFRAGLQPLQSAAIVLSGCPTREGVPVDAVTVGAPVKACQPAPAPVRLQRAHSAGEALLNLVAEAQGRAAVHLEGTGREYDALTDLAMALEMSAEEGPPLARLLPGRDTRRWDPEAVRRASGYLGIRFTSLIPMELANACSVFPLRFISSLPAGRRVIACTHDDDLSCLARALGLIHDDDPTDDLAMYPMESWVFALNTQKVAVVRLRMTLSPDGSFSGSFSSRLVWQGTWAEWAARLAEVERQAQSWAPGREARWRLPMLPAEPLNVLFRP